MCDSGFFVANAKKENELFYPSLSFLMYRSFTSTTDCDDDKDEKQ